MVGGLYAARAESGAGLTSILDRRNHHVFSRSSIMVAMAALSPGTSRHQFAGFLPWQRNVEVFLADATAIDTDGKRVTSRTGRLSYVHDRRHRRHARYFGHDECAAG